jgi:ABC-type glutathione transport system ATPase component
LKSVSLPSGEDDQQQRLPAKRASQLSVGQAQRVLIAMAIIAPSRAPDRR